MAHFPLIHISGKPHARGMLYGRQAAGRIALTLDIYRTAYTATGAPWERAREMARRFRGAIEAYSPAMMEEMEGIAAGCEVAVEDIIALNARTEMLYGATGDDGEKTDEGCTGAIVLPQASADGHLLHAQNWDWRSDCEHNTIMLRIARDDGPDILTMVEAGMMARCGFNSAGIALTGNFLKCQYDFGKSGVPVPLVRRAILESPSLAEATRRVFTAPRSFSTNVMISHAGGEALNLEATPPEVFWVKPDDGLLVHSNHFVSIGALARMTDLALSITPDSLYRDDRVRRYLAQRRGAITIDDLKAAFADDYGAPYAVCRRPVEGPGGYNSSTVATIVMDVTAQQALVAVAPHRSVEYWRYDMTSAAPVRV